MLNSCLRKLQIKVTAPAAPLVWRLIDCGYDVFPSYIYTSDGPLDGWSQLESNHHVTKMAHISQHEVLGSDHATRLYQFGTLWTAALPLAPPRAF